MIRSRHGVSGFGSRAKYLIGQSEPDPGLQVLVYLHETTLSVIGLGADLLSWPRTRLGFNMHGSTSGNMR